MRQAIFVSATPADYEQRMASQVVEQLVRAHHGTVTVEPTTHGTTIAVTLPLAAPDR